MDKIEKLTKALIRAKNEGLKAENADNGEDGGTCNFDCAVLYLPHWKEQDINKAFSDAKLTYTVSRFCGKKCYDVENPAHGMANRVTRSCDAMVKSLQEDGFEASARRVID